VGDLRGFINACSADVNGAGHGISAMEGGGEGERDSLIRRIRAGKEASAGLLYLHEQTPPIVHRDVSGWGERGNARVARRPVGTVYPVNCNGARPPQQMHPEYDTLHSHTHSCARRKFTRVNPQIKPENFLVGAAGEIKVCVCVHMCVCVCVCEWKRERVCM